MKEKYISTIESSIESNVTVIESFIESYTEPFVESFVESFKEHQISKIIETINIKIQNALKSHYFNPRIAPYLKKINKKGVPYTDFSENPDNISQIKKFINALYHAKQAFIDLESIDITQWSRSGAAFGRLYSNTIREAYKASYLLTHMDVDFTGIFTEEYILLKQVQAKIETKLASWAKYLGIDTKELTKTLKDNPAGFTSGLIMGTALDQMKPTEGERDFNFLADFGSALPGYIDRFTSFINSHTSGLIDKESKLNQEKLLELQNAAFRILQEIDNLQSKNFIVPLKILNYIGIVRHTITLSMSIFEQLGNLSDSSQDYLREKIAFLKYTLIATLFGVVDKIEDNSMLKPGTLTKTLMQKIQGLYQVVIYYSSKFINFEAKGEELLSIEDSKFVSLRLELTYKRIDEANKSLFKIQKALDAFNTFYEILEKDKYKDYSLNRLPYKTKQKLLFQYKLIKPYLDKLDIDLSKALMNDLAQSASWGSYLTNPRGAKATKDTRVSDVKAALRALINKDRVSQQFHIDLNEDLIASVHRQSDITLFPYNGDHVFEVNELDALSSGKDAFQIMLYNHEWIILSTLGSNLEQLTSSQALDLYQWYKKKLKKFQDANTAYREFLDILRNIKANSPNPDLDIDFEQLDAYTRLECRNLYNRFQPYFVNGVPYQDRKKALEIDKHLCHFFSGKPTKETTLNTNVFEAFDEGFQNYFSSVGLEWNKRSKFYLQLASKKYAKETQELPLEEKDAPASRSHHLIKHTLYSEFFKEFRKNLFAMVNHLNNHMNANLQTAKPFLPFAESEATESNQAWTVFGYSITTPKQYYKKAKQTANGYFDKQVLPFPELEDANTTLAQPKQVLAIKKLFNSIYHIEQIILVLEQLNDKHTQTRYVIHLLQGFVHINKIFKLSQSLAADAHFKLLGQKFFHKFQELLATVEEHSDAYQMPAENVPYGTEVQNNPLWYIINGFFISPKHIRTLRNTNFTTTEELDKLHRNAKKTTLRIEKIINDSNSYLKLFLHIPKMYKLYENLRHKLTEFTSTTHDAVLNNLDQIKATLFSPILIEADKWEDDLGLKPGFISGPLKEITDEFFKGLLYPLKLDSKTHLKLVNDAITIQDRMDTCFKKREGYVTRITKVQKQQAKMASFKNQLDSYINYNDPQSTQTSPQSEIEQQQHTLIKGYKTILPTLVRLHSRIELTEDANPIMLKMDKLLNSSSNEYDKKFSNIYGLVTGCLSYYTGVIASCEMKIKSATEKCLYLREASNNQEQYNLDFQVKYTESAFDKQVEYYSNRYYGLQYVHIEYRDTLNEHLQTFKQSIVSSSLNAHDINEAVKIKLEEQIKLFEAVHLPKYHHLDTVRNAIAQFRTYFIKSIEGKHGSLESQNTLAAKTKLINELDSVALDKKLSIDQRIERMQKAAQPVRFQGILLNHRNPNVLSFAFLKQLVLALLEALHLYTPERKKLYKNLNHAINTAPQPNRFSLFPPAPKPKPQPEPQQPSLTQPEVQL